MIQVDPKKTSWLQAVDRRKFPAVHLKQGFYSHLIRRLYMKRHFKKTAVLIAWIAVSTLSAYAEGDGSAGITKATSMLSSYFDPATKLIYAAGAIVGLIGAIKVYSKFSSGDPDTGKTAGSWFGACVFLIVAATVLRSFFL